MLVIQVDRAASPRKVSSRWNTRMNVSWVYSAA